MPQYDEEMNRRREKREAMRKKREAEARRLKWTLFLAVLILAGCVGGIAALVRSAGGGEAPQTEVRQTQPQTEATQAPSDTPAVLQNPITTIHIKAAGDLNVTDSVVKSGQTATSYDYSIAFKDVTAILSDADLTVMNFEGNVCGEPYGTETTSAPIELIQGLRSAGVDLLQMANSCSINNGLNGLTATLRAIRSCGIEPLGAYSTASEFQSAKGYTIVDIQGVKVAFVAFTKGLGGRGMPAGNEELVNLLYVDYATTYQDIDRDRINSILDAVDAERPDVTVAMLHWGSEYNDDISKTQKSIVSLLQKRGVDVILGTHPHTVQPLSLIHI